MLRLVDSTCVCIYVHAQNKLWLLHTNVQLCTMYMYIESVCSLTCSPGRLGYLESDNISGSLKNSNSLWDCLVEQTFTIDGQHLITYLQGTSSE